MPASASAPTRVPVRVADCFLLAHDAFMRRTGQGGQVSHSILVLDRVPDLEKLRAAGNRLVQKHPLLVARLRRNWRTWLPYWAVPVPPARGLPLWLWHERGSPGALGSEARATADALAQLQLDLAEPLEEGGQHFNARLEIVECRDGSCLLALAWTHLLLDGKGAELLLTELAQLCAGVDEAWGGPEVVRPALGVKVLIEKTKPAIQRLSDLSKLGIVSLSGPRARRGRGHYRIITLNAADSAQLHERVERMVGALFPLAFYVACTARAHQCVLDQRGTKVGGFVASVPIQTRKRGGRGPLFHNRVTIFFFAGTRAVLATLEGASLAMKQQFAEMTRGRLDESFNAVLELMMRLPAWLFMRVVRTQFRGEICSFFHSHTGAFAPELTELAGARLTNAYHLPCLGTPPGSGIFFSEFGARVSIAFSWREGSTTEAERRLMIAHLLHDALGAERPDLLDAR